MSKKKKLNEFEAGAASFNVGLSEYDNPHPKENGNNQDRIDWFNGFFHAQIGKKLEKVFEKHGIKW